jgi:GNAT superfamily N-acetyltransferase
LGPVDLGCLVPPAPLSLEHQLDGFQCIEGSLERWLKERARQNDAQGASRTYVVAAGYEVVGYYCLSAGSVVRGDTPQGMRRNMPDPIPVILLGRLAVHQAWSGKGIGSGLLKDAVLRSIAVTQTVGARALLCHAVSPEARRFYLKHGFIESPVDPMTVMLNLTSLAKSTTRG